MDTQKLIERIECCEAICREAQNDTTGTYFDPFRVLTGTETPTQKMYSASVNFLHSIEEAYNTFTKNTTFNVALFR